MSLERALQLNIERRISDATRILTHYIVQASPGIDRRDTTAEMHDVVSSIVDAAAMTVQMNKLAVLERKAALDVSRGEQRRVFGKTENGTPVNPATGHEAPPPASETADEDNQDVDTLSPELRAEIDARQG